MQKPKCTKVIWKIKTNLRWNVVKIGKNYLEQANWWELLFWLKRASLVYDILSDSFLDFLSFLYVGVKKDPGRVVCQSKIELPERHLGIITWHKRPLNASLVKSSQKVHMDCTGAWLTFSKKMGAGGGGKGERVGSNRSNFDKVLGELL